MIKSNREDMAALGLAKPTHEPKVSEHIDDIITMIETLVKKGFAYSTQDGDVYFSVVKKMIMGNFRTNLWARCSLEREQSQQVRRSQIWTLLSGSRIRPPALPGQAPGEKGVQAGISNVQRCRSAISGIPLIFMVVGET